MLDGHHLYPEGQLGWLETGLLESRATWKFILSPVVFNTTLQKKDSWHSYYVEHDAIVAYINEHRITNVILLSADIHAGAIDNGKNAGLPEMAVPGANIVGTLVWTQEPNRTPTVLTTCYSGYAPKGDWSEGTYPSGTPPPSCPGYGVISVFTGNHTGTPTPPWVLFQVKDEDGNVKVEYSLTAVPPTATPTR